MKAIWYEQTGPATQVLTYGDMDIPTPRAGEILVRLYASGVNPSDVKARAGARAGGAGLAWPRIVPHSDGAGQIEAVGPEVSPQRIGQRVWVWNAQWQRPLGTAAQYVTIPQDQAVWLPDAASYAIGACLGIPATTAHRCIYADGPVEGQTILVTGGAGTVARYAIQMAKLGGATVITTVSGPEKSWTAQAAGADHVLNYRDQDVTEAVLELTSGQGVDRIVEVEFGANLSVTPSVLRTGGIIAAYGSAGQQTPTFPFYPLLFKSATLHLVLVYLLPPHARSQAIADITQWLNNDCLSPAIAATIPLAQTADAHTLVESAAKLGTVVVTTD